MDERKETAPDTGESRRDAIKKLAYVTPVVLSLAVSPAFARPGSGSPSLRHGSTNASQDDNSLNN